MEITLKVPDDLAIRLRPVENDLPRILELGMREFSVRGEPGFAGLTDVLEALAALPTPEEVLALRPSAALQERIDVLLKRKRKGSGIAPSNIWSVWPRPAALKLEGT